MPNNPSYPPISLEHRNIYYYYYTYILYIIYKSITYKSHSKNKTCFFRIICKVTFLEQAEHLEQNPTPASTRLYYTLPLYPHKNPHHKVLIRTTKTLLHIPLPLHKKPSQTLVLYV